jgi:DNA-3-methyladenine glycosylase I
MVLDSFQAGLSWKTILHKRKGFEKAFRHYDFIQVSKFSEEEIQALYSFDGIIKNKLKINATVTNAQAFIKIIENFGSFDEYIWKFTQNKPIQSAFESQSQIPAQNEIVLSMSKDLKKLGFKFVGPTICYAFMQASGMVNDHITSCFRYNEIKNLK